MISEFSAAVQVVKVLKDILAAAHELKDSTALTAAVNEVHGKLVIAFESVINSQKDRFAMQERVSELEKEIAAIKDWKEECERYTLTEIGKGVFAFVVKPDCQNGEPSHKLCCACFGKRQKGYLQFFRHDGLGDHFKCDLCHAEILCVSHNYLRSVRNEGDGDYNPLDPDDVS